MSDFSLTVNERKVSQQSKLTELRKNSMLPAVVYGFNQEPISLEGDYREIFKVVVEAGTSNIIELNVGTKKIKVIVKEYQLDPVTDKLTHVDFFAIDDKRKITTKVPLKFTGLSSEVRELGGQLDEKNDIVNVKCLPGDLPSIIEVNTTKLKDIGQNILIGDLEVGDKVEILNNPKEPIVSAIIPKKIKIKEETTATEAVEGAEGEAVEGAEGATPAEGAEGATPAEGAEKKDEGK